MNLEAINKWLDEEYGCSFTKLEELHNFYFEKYCDLKQENQKQKEVIDKIKHILNSQMNYREFVDIVNAIEDVVKGVSE